MIYDASPPMAAVSWHRIQNSQLTSLHNICNSSSNNKHRTTNITTLTPSLNKKQKKIINKIMLINKNRNTPRFYDNLSHRTHLPYR